VKGWETVRVEVGDRMFGREWDQRRYVGLKLGRRFGFQCDQRKCLDPCIAGMGWATVAPDGFGGSVGWNTMEGNEESPSGTECD
jgi:hypothetical protein